MLQITNETHLGNNFFGYETYMFSSNESTSERISDFSTTKCVLISNSHSKVADNTHFETLAKRKEILKDFNEFLGTQDINPKDCHKPVYSLCIYLGEGDGHILEDLTLVENLLKRYCKEYGTWAVCIPQLNQYVKDSKFSLTQEHVNILFEKPNKNGIVKIGSELSDYIIRYK